MNYIALGVVAEIDNIYAATLRDPRIKKALEKEKLPIIYVRGTNDFEITLLIRLQKGIWLLGKFFFVVFYYYFTPYVTISFSLLLVGDPPKPG